MEAQGPALPLMYTELAGWFHLITAPADYGEEADFYWKAIVAAARRPVATMLELGSGGGNNASHLKHRVAMTLVDLSAAMVRLSEQINPECEHLVGDMRTVQLNQLFDAVFIHDAIDYMATEPDLRAAVANAAHHVRPGGVVLLAPDHVADTFRESISEGGHTDGVRSVHYRERTWDPDPGDSTYLADYTYRLSEPGQADRRVEDRHVLGLFPRFTWLDALESAGLEPEVVIFKHSEVELPLEVFVATAPADDVGR